MPDIKSKHDMDRIKKHFEEVTDVWRLYRQYAGISNDPADDPKWDELVHVKAVEIQNGHGNTQFIRGLVMVVLELLESEAKEMSA